MSWRVESKISSQYSISIFWLNSNTQVKNSDLNRVLMNWVLDSNSSTRLDAISLEIYDKCKQWSKTHDIKFLMTKHKLIHFTRTFKWFNMKVDVKLMKHQIDLKSNIRILRVQLNFKLRWVIYMYHVEAKLVIKQKIMQTIIEFT